MVKASYLFFPFSLTVTVGALSVNVLSFTKDNNARFLPIFCFQKLGREVSRILLLSYSFEISVALTYAIFGCIGLVSVRVVSGKSRDVDF